MSKKNTEGAWAAEQWAIPLSEKEEVEKYTTSIPLPVGERNFRCPSRVNGTVVEQGTVVEHMGL